MDSMFTQYLAWYQRYRTKYGTNTAVLMQVGKFFEIYDRLDLSKNTTHTNIREIADLCSLNLSEGVVDENTMKLCGGFPEQSLPKFERQLLDSGYTVVIIVQKKNANGEVEERTVERISSPGIYENRYSSGSQNSQNSNQDSCLIGILMERNDHTSYYIGITAVDIQTGNTWTTECTMPFIQHTPNIDCLEPFFLMHPPAEIVCWFTDETHTHKESELRAWFRLPKTTVIHIRHTKSVKPNPEFVRQAFSFEANLQPHIVLGLEKYQQAYNCVGLTLNFIDEHIPSLLKKLRNNTVWIPDDRVRLGNAALEQLNIVSNNHECLLYFFQKTFTAVGRRSLRERCITPISNISELKQRFARIDFLRNLTTDPEIEKSLRSVYDLSRLHRKLHLFSLSYTDIHHLLLTYSAIENLIKKFHNSPIAIHESRKILEWLTSKQEIWSIERIKTADPLLIHRTHPWKLGVFPELDDLEKDWKNLVSEINEFAQRNPNSPINVAIGEHHVFEFTITKKRFDKLPENQFKFHPNSAKSAIGSLESKEISEFQKRGNQIRKSWSEKQDAYWIQSLDIWSRSCDLSNFPISEFITNWIANLDAEFALARCALEFQLITPTFIDHETSSVVLEELRHPIIEQIHTGSPYVRHNISLGTNDEAVGAAENGLLVYGSNSSGKSSLMKSLGIAVICAQAGIPVAASKMVISPYTGIFTRILGNDNLWASLSSFAVEMTEFRSILKYSNQKSLVLGDELCSGTETRSATAIVSAGIQTMVKRGSQFLLATHLHEISELDEIRKLQGVKFVHLGIEYDPKTNAIIYKRTLQSGSGSALYGLEVCYGLDMDEEFLKLATSSRQNLNKFSRYNSQVPVRKCEICDSEKNLESHHIIHQADAKDGYIAPGAKIHRQSNLTVLCELCHKEHHAGTLTIHGWIDSSAGRILNWSRINSANSQNKNREMNSENSSNSQNKNHEMNSDNSCIFTEIKDSLRLLMSKGKKEKEILQALELETDSSIKLADLRKWKKLITQPAV